MAKNFNKRGFTTFGLSNYSFLRREGVSNEKAVSMLIREDKARKNAVTFRKRHKRR